MTTSTTNLGDQCRDGNDDVDGSDIYTLRLDVIMLV
jgi:hypothetical protein